MGGVGGRVCILTVNHSVTCDLMNYVFTFCTAKADNCVLTVSAFLLR